MKYVQNGNVIMIFFASISQNESLLRFKYIPHEENPDSGFNLLKIKRTEVVELFEKMDDKARSIFSEDIVFALGRELIGDNSWTSKVISPEFIYDKMDFLKHILEHENLLNNLAYCITDLLPELEPNWQKLLIELPQIILESEKPLIKDKVPPLYRLLQAVAQQYKQNRFHFLSECAIPELFKSYVKEGLGQQLDLGGVAIYFVAQHQKIALRVWQQNIDSLVLVPNPFPSSPISDTSPLDLFWDAQRGHFYSLQRIS